jgi:hypothetical protein
VDQSGVAIEDTGDLVTEYSAQCGVVPHCGRGVGEREEWGDEREAEDDDDSVHGGSSVVRMEVHARGHEFSGALKRVAAE